MSSGERTTYILIDGENIDATLGTSILMRRPQPEERARWDRVRAFVEQEWAQPARGLFFLAASNGELPMAFVQALIAMGYTPIPLAGEAHEKVVDIAIQRTLTALQERDADVMLISNDGDFVDELGELLDGRRVGLIGFQEMRSSRFVPLQNEGLSFYDLEYDVHAFNAPLPRVRIIPIAAFDPLEFL